MSTIATSPSSGSSAAPSCGGGTEAGAAPGVPAAAPAPSADGGREGSPSMWRVGKREESRRSASASTAEASDTRCRIVLLARRVGPSSACPPPAPPPPPPPAAAEPMPLFDNALRPHDIRLETAAEEVALMALAAATAPALTDLRMSTLPCAAPRSTRMRATESSSECGSSVSMWTGTLSFRSAAKLEGRRVSACRRSTRR